jgi:uncharacterized repeat protein (TIGR03847 family)
MSRNIFDFQNPERFVAGTVGMPGERTFYLQAKEGNKISSVSLEKSQVALLAERILNLLKEMNLPPKTVVLKVDDAPLELPLMDDFRVGVIAIAWEPATQQLMIEAQAGESEEVIDHQISEGPDLFRVTLTASMAKSFALRSNALVKAGRPPCQFCGNPLDPSAHLCPRANGYRR